MSSVTPIHVGAGEVDISPPLGTHLGGDAVRLRRCDRILHPIYARALVAGPADAPPEQRLCVITLDCCIIGNDLSDDIRRQVAERFGFRREAIMLHLMQNHSAPSLGDHLLLTADSPYVSQEYWWVYQGDPDYIPFLIPRIMEAVEQAVASVQPVTMGCLGRADGRISFNRRYLKRDGWVQTQPRDQDLFDVLRPEGPADPEVGVAAFKDRDGRVIAALLHHTGHPCSHFGTNWVTSSWPGAWCRRFKELLGDQCVPLMINGSCGNINVRDATRGEAPDDDTVADWLMQTTGRVMDAMTYAEPTVADFRSVTLDIPFSNMEEQIGVEDVEAARQFLRENPEPIWQDDTHTKLDIQWVFAVVIDDMARRITPDKNFPYEVQTFRIGDLALTGWVGETFAEGQLQTKQNSPAERTFVAHMCNGFICYVPTRAAWRAKNYNFLSADGKPVRRGANLFLLQDDALERVVATARKSIDELFA